MHHYELIAEEVNRPQRHDMKEPQKIKEVKISPMTFRLPKRIQDAIAAEVNRSGLTKNTVVHLWLSDHIERLKQPRFTPYALIDRSAAILYDGLKSELVVVHVAEDTDELIQFECEKHVASTTCEHIEFVEQIPSIKELIQESEAEFHAGEEDELTEHFPCRYKK